MNALPVARRGSRSPETTDVVAIPDTPWDRIVWTNRQHVMRRLPELDTSVRVLYVAPPRVLSRPLRASAVQAGRPSLWTRRLAERLWVVQPLLPVPRRWAARVAPGFDEQLMMAVARRAARKLGFERPCVWTYAPQYADFVGALNERCVIYDVVDDYSAMPYYQRTLGARVHELDQRLTERADLVFVVNDFLFDQRRAWNASVRHVGNAGDVKGFMRARATGEIPNDLRALGSPVIGFHGTLTGEKIDVRLVEDLIRQRPEWAFVFIGPIKDPAIAHHLRQHANVSLLGPRNATVLPEYVAGFDVLLIPYRRTAYTGRPLKVYEGLAAGVPIVATGLPELDREPGVVVAEQSAAAVTAAVERVLRSPRAPVRPEEVQGYSWEAKAARQLACVRDVLAAKAEG